MFKELVPDLVTLDVMMPTVQGVDSLAAFRAIRAENPHAVVLIVTAIPFEKTRDTYLEEGAMAYIIKPFTKFSFDQVRMRLSRAFPDLGVR